MGLSAIGLLLTCATLALVKQSRSDAFVLLVIGGLFFLCGRDAAGGPQEHDRLDVPDPRRVAHGPGAAAAGARADPGLAWMWMSVAVTAMVVMGVGLVWTFPRWAADPDA